MPKIIFSIMHKAIAAMVLTILTKNSLASSSILIIYAGFNNSKASASS
jgi:hypothetical protein